MNNFRVAFVSDVPPNVAANQKMSHLQIQLTLIVLNFVGPGKKLKTAGVRNKNLAIQNGSYYQKSGHI